jgi:glycosyltransferase involved in cell wall biosynthesis
VKVDVAIPTKNSARTIRRCIQCIKEYIPYNRIIILDDSEDDTPLIARELGAEVHHVPGMLGMKRYMQGVLAETEWIASIDSDIFIYDNWWETLSAEIQDEVGAVTGWLDSDFGRSFPAYDSYTKYMAMWRYRTRKQGGAIGNTLVRRDLLLNSKHDLEGVHAGEDHILGLKCAALGLRWTVLQVPIGLHHHENAKGHHRMAYYRAGRSTVINRGRFRSLKSLMGCPVKAGLNWSRYSWAMRTCNLPLLWFLIILHGLTMKGILDELLSPSSQLKSQTSGSISSS